MIRFQFQPESAVQAAAYLLKRLGNQTDKVKLMKLLYLADRDHFVQHNRPITRDSQWALPHGPVPSCTLNLLNSSDDDGGEYSAAHIGCEAKTYKLSADPGVSMLRPTDLAILDAVLARYGRMHTWALRDHTHNLPEYLECNVPGTSAPIPYEVILRFYGGEEKYRHNRPVISQEMAAHMLCPFRASEPDL